jgi:predicted GTPase
MGEKGAGKSTVCLLFLQKYGIEPYTQFINAAAGEPLAEVGHDLDPCTSTVKHFVLRHHKYDVVLVDTPGFNHPLKTDGVILEEIINWLKSKSVLSQFIYYILILHQMLPSRVLPRTAVRRYYLSA